MNIKNQSKFLSLTIAAVAIAGLTMSTPAFAETPNQKPPHSKEGEWEGRPGMNGRMGMIGKPVAVGTVTAINGTTITISGRTGFGTSTPATSFTVNAANAVVKKANATSTLSAIVVGDNVMIQGTISGTTITATMIHDGIMPKKGEMRGMGDQDEKMTPPITGNGQPVIAGTVSAISGSTITLTNKSNVTYTIDTATAKFTQGKDTITLANVVVGDELIVQGTINGNSVVASSVIDGGHAQTPEKKDGNGNHGFFGGIGSFFKHLFGF